MANLPIVKLQIVLGGVADIKRQIKTIKKALHDLENSQMRSAKSSSKQVESVYRRSYASRLKSQRVFNRNSISIGKSNDNKAERLRKQSYRDRLKDQRSYQRRYLANMKRLARKEKAIFKKSGLARSSGKLGIGGISGGSKIAAGIGGAIGMIGGGSGIGAALMAGGGALGGIKGVALMAGALALGKAFSFVASSIQQSATEMISGITSIGGGFSISDAMMRSAKAERMAVFIAGNAGRNDPISAGAVTRWSRRMGTGTEFNQLEWSESLKAFQQMTGEVSGFKNNAEFFGKLASVSGASLEDLGEAAGLLKKQFKDFKDVDIKDIFLKMWESGKSGVIEITDIPKLTEVIGFASAIKGDEKQNIMDIIGGVQIVAPFVGGSASESVTRIKALRSLMLKNPEKLSAIVGSETMYKDKETGEFKFHSINKLFASMAYIGKYEKKLLRGIAPNIRQQEAAIALSESGIPEMTDTEKKDKDIPGYIDRLAKHFEDLNKMEGNVSDLDKAFLATTNTVEYQLKQAFNELGEEVGGKLLQAIIANKNEIINLVKAIANSTPALVGLFDAMVSVLPLFNTAILNVINTLNMLGLIDLPDKKGGLESTKGKLALKEKYGEGKVDTAGVIGVETTGFAPPTASFEQELKGGASYQPGKNVEQLINNAFSSSGQQIGDNFNAKTSGVGAKIGEDFIKTVNDMKFSFVIPTQSTQPGPPNRSGSPTRSNN